MKDKDAADFTFLLADDHLIVRQGLQFVIEDLYENSQILQVSGIQQILKILDENMVDVLILDAQFPDGNSLTILPEIKSKHPNLKILIFTSFEEEHYALKFIEAGANGYLSKLGEEAQIQEAIQSIVERGQYYPPLTQKLLEIAKHNPLISNPLNQLSERELEIARLYIKGYGNLEIANELSIKQNTVSTYKHRIFEKLNISSFVELVEIMKINDASSL